MFIKTKIAITTAILLTAASTTFASPRQNSSLPQFAYETPENRIGDNYPFLEQVQMPVTRVSAVRSNLRSQVLPQFASETPENRIGDNYPFLEAYTRPIAAAPTRINVSMLRVRQYGRDTVINF